MECVFIYRINWHKEAEKAHNFTIQKHTEVQDVIDDSEDTNKKIKKFNAKIFIKIFVCILFISFFIFSFLIKDFKFKPNSSIYTNSNLTIT